MICVRRFFVGVMCFVLCLMPSGAFGWERGAVLPPGEGKTRADWEVNVSANMVDGVYTLSFLWTKDGIPYGSRDEDRMFGTASPLGIRIVKTNGVVLGPKYWPVSSRSKRADLPILLYRPGAVAYVAGMVRYSDEVNLPFVVFWDPNTLVPEMYLGQRAYDSFMEKMASGSKEG